jgi:hypothetical protein
MPVGVVSDTHDDMEAIARVVELFNARGVSQVVHAGDLVSPFTFELFGELQAEFIGIFGNNDGDRLLLAERSGGRVRPQPRLITLEGKRAVVVHEPHLVETLAGSGDFDIVVYGHTHTADVRRVGRTLIVNPGKAARLHRGRSTAALLDTGPLGVEIVELFPGEGGSGMEASAPGEKDMET